MYRSNWSPSTPPGPGHLNFRNLVCSNSLPPCQIYCSNAPSKVLIRRSNALTPGKEISFYIPISHFSSVLFHFLVFTFRSFSVPFLEGCVATKQPTIPSCHIAWLPRLYKVQLYLSNLAILSFILFSIHCQWLTISFLS